LAENVGRAFPEVASAKGNGFADLGSTFGVEVAPLVLVR
jgi:hypothetical protein